MRGVFLDTHVVVWLYQGDVEKLSTSAQAAIEANELLISPAVKLELGYLHELKRVVQPPYVVITDLATKIGLLVDDAGFERVVEGALAIRFTRDPFDRLIVAQAQVSASSLVTKDRVIRKHYAHALW